MTWWSAGQSQVAKVFALKGRWISRLQTGLLPTSWVWLKATNSRSLCLPQGNHCSFVCASERLNGQRLCSDIWRLDPRSQTTSHSHGARPMQLAHRKQPRTSTTPREHFWASPRANQNLTCAASTTNFFLSAAQPQPNARGLTVALVSGMPLCRAALKRATSSPMGGVASRIGGRTVRKRNARTTR